MILNTVLRCMAWPMMTARRCFWSVFICVFTVRFVRHLIQAYQDGRLSLIE